MSNCTFHSARIRVNCANLWVNTLTVTKFQKLHFNYVLSSVPTFAAFRPTILAIFGVKIAAAASLTGSVNFTRNQATAKLAKCGFSESLSAYLLVHSQFCKYPVIISTSVRLSLAISVFASSA
mmetsp:Transcript_16814/g.36452  ORF Transcript_16814/g.36452 Transcript_16814/m.36452 type:complete len:123 (-) Transcript_16814:943-1311(-)